MRWLPILAAVAVVSAAAGGLRAESKPTAPSATQPAASQPSSQPTTASRPSIPVQQAKKGLFDGEYTGPGAGELLWQMLAAVIVILVLGGVAIFVIKRVLPKIGRLPGKRIAIVESAYLGPKQSVYILRVGSRRLLVASTRERISLLTDVTEALGEVPEPADEPGDESKA